MNSDVHWTRLFSCWKLYIFFKSLLSRRSLLCPPSCCRCCCYLEEFVVTKATLWSFQKRKGEKRREGKKGENRTFEFQGQTWSDEAWAWPENETENERTQQREQSQQQHQQQRAFQLLTCSFVRSLVRSFALTCKNNSQPGRTWPSLILTTPQRLSFLRSFFRPFYSLRFPYLTSPQLTSPRISSPYLLPCFSDLCARLNWRNFLLRPHLCERVCE